MTLILEVKAGRLAGKRIEVRPGQQIIVGRSPQRANFAVPSDSFMSGQHFAVECGPQGCRLVDRKSSNGTFLNGSRITEAVLADGDEVRSGKTTFVARVVVGEETAAPAPSQAPSATVPSPPVPKPAGRTPDAKQAPGPQAPPATPVEGHPEAPAPPATKRPQGPPASTPQPQPAGGLVVACWRFGTVPEGWKPNGEFGIQRVVKDEFPASVVATQEPLSAPTLQQQVEAQVSMLKQYLREPQIEAALPPAIPGAEETVALDVRYSTKDGQVIFIRRIFSRHAKRAGTLTITAMEKDLPELRPSLDSILASIEFLPAP